MNEYNEYADNMTSAPNAIYAEPAMQENALLSPKDVKKKIRQSYNRTGGALLIHFVISQAVVLAIGLIYEFVVIANGASVDEAAAALTIGFWAVFMNAAAYFVANPLGCLIGLAMTGRKKGTKLMIKPKISRNIILWAIPVTMGLQSISILLQQIFRMLSGTEGISEEMVSAMSFGNGTASDIVLFLYMVIVGPIGEELVYRGMALKNLSCVSRKFAIISSALLFGLMHGNILQFIIGFIIGIFFAYIDVKADSILPSTILHIINNFIAVVMSISELTLSENVYDTAVTVYIAAAIIAGIIGLVMIRKLIKASDENKEINENEETQNYPELYAVPDESSGSLTWKQAAACPCLWIFALLYVCIIISAL